MQEYGGSDSSKTGEYRDPEGPRDRNVVQQLHQNDIATRNQYQNTQHQYNEPVKQHIDYGHSNKDTTDPNIVTYCRVATGVYEVTASNPQYHNPRYTNTSVPTFCSPPNSPLVGLIFDPLSPNYTGPGMMGDRNLSHDRRSQSSWSNSNQEPIGTGAKKKIVKSQDKRTIYTNDARHAHERYRDNDGDRQRKDRNFASESTSSLDFFVEGERMVSELCNVSESNASRADNSYHKQHTKSHNDEDKPKSSGSSDIFLTALDKIIIHDQIPNQIVQLAIEACTDAENIAIAHHNRPCFKNIHSICAKTRSNVQKPDSAVANLHSQGIPWVIKNFIFSFVRILDGWKGVKELLSEKHETFSRIENKYYSPNIRECFVQWQAVTKEMLTHIYKTFKCLDHGFTMEQKSFTHNYYATNSAGPRHQNQNKFQPVKSHVNAPRPVNASPQSFNVVQPPWVQNQNQCNQNFSENPWPARSGVTCKKIPVIPLPNTHNFFSLNEQSELDMFQKNQYKEAKPRQSWTITNVSDFRALEGLCQADQREVYTQLKHKIDAELGKNPVQPPIANIHYDLLLRREIELKSKMIPLSHVEKTLIPSMATNPDTRGCYLQKNNSCGDIKEDSDFFAAWGQMVQKEPNEFMTHQSHNVQIPPNVVALSNVSGPVQFVDHENDEFHEISKVYMKPGSYKVPIKPDPVTPFGQGASQEVVYDSPATEEIASLKLKVPYTAVTLAPQPKYNLESWPCLMPRRAEDLFSEEQKPVTRQGPCLDLRHSDPLEILSAMTSDRAWEAAKQSAPKLMDFIHEGSKSDTARLYDALGLNSTSEEYQDEVPQEIWPANHYIPKEVPSLWDTLNSAKKDDRPISNNVSVSYDLEEQVESSQNKNDFKERIRCRNYDQSGSYIRDDTHKKANSKPKVSGNWYHPKKKKPLAAPTLKKFETIVSSLSQIQEAKFVLGDMDIKVAPRFYEVVRHPMCLNDISTKLKSSSYSDQEQVVHDFRRIFNNVGLYLRHFPDSMMEKNIHKVSTEFEKILIEEFPNKNEAKGKAQDNAVGHQQPLDTKNSAEKKDQAGNSKNMEQNNKPSNVNAEKQ